MSFHIGKILGIDYKGGCIMLKQDMKIGLALSGGGMRAAIFHLGVLKWLAEQGLLKRIHHISSVSGASIAVGLIFANNDNQWPSDVTFLSKVLPAMKRDIITKDIQWTALCRLIVSPYYWNKKANLLAHVMEKRWKITACLQDIPTLPLWTINTTAYETGKDFRISAKRMGSQYSFVQRPRFPLSHAICASAGFPVFIGPYTLKTKAYVWSDVTGSMIVRVRDETLHLWDGGVYDNMGLDPLFSFQGQNKLCPEINYLIVSNASMDKLEHKMRTIGYSFSNLKRLLAISMTQSQLLRKQEVIDFMEQNKQGLFLQIGSQTKDMLRHCDISFARKQELLHASLKESDVLRVSSYKTTLERVKKDDFERILRHGYEVAKLNSLCSGHIS